MDTLKKIRAIRANAPVAFVHHPLSVARFKSTVRLGLKSLWNHQLRSMLTALGIVFGVCSVIAMLAIGEGASYEAQEQIRQLGSNNIIIRSIKPVEEKKSTSKQSLLVEYGLTYTDVEAIKETIKSVEVKVPGRLIRKDVWNGGRRVDCDIFGTVPEYIEVNNRTLVEGRYFTELDMENKSNVCVLPTEIVSKLFPIDSPLGRTVRVGTQYYLVIGVIEPRTFSAESLKPQTEGSQGATSSRPRMFIPLTTAKERFGETLAELQSGSLNVERCELHEVTVKVNNPEDVAETAKIIEALLKHNHKKKDYELVVPLELLKRAERTKQIFNIVLGGIAAISLLVGGIGIMNIMLASVTERTREIGIRRALGARRQDIVIQFLIETVILSGAGGLIGVALGLAIPFLVTKFAHMVTIVTFWSPMLAFSISALVGILFGLYPAKRAAEMDPVEALRHE